MGRVLSHGLMAVYMLANITRTRSMALVCSVGLMGASTMASGRKENSMATAPTPLGAERLVRASGKMVSALVGSPRRLEDHSPHVGHKGGLRTPHVVDSNR